MYICIHTKSFRTKNKLPCHLYLKYLDTQTYPYCTCIHKSPREWTRSQIPTCQRALLLFFTPEPPKTFSCQSKQQAATSMEKKRYGQDMTWHFVRCITHMHTQALNPASWCLRLPCWSQKRFFKFYAFLTPLCFHIHTVTGNSLSSCCLHAQRRIKRDKFSVYGLLLCFLQPCVVCWCKRSLIEMIKEKRLDALIIIHQGFNCKWHGSCIRESFKPDRNCFSKVKSLRTNLCQTKIQYEVCDEK